jgi:hypothetical protein
MSAKDMTLKIGPDPAIATACEMACSGGIHLHDDSSGYRHPGDGIAEETKMSEPNHARKSSPRSC